MLPGLSRLSTCAQTRTSSLWNSKPSNSLHTSKLNIHPNVCSAVAENCRDKRSRSEPSYLAKIPRLVRWCPRRRTSARYFRARPRPSPTCPPNKYAIIQTSNRVEGEKTEATCLPQNRWLFEPSLRLLVGPESGPEIVCLPSRLSRVRIPSPAPSIVKRPKRLPDPSGGLSFC